MSLAGTGLKQQTSGCQREVYFLDEKKIFGRKSWLANKKTQSVGGKFI